MRSLTIIVFIGLMLSGCGSKVLLPYEENVLCKRGSEEGMCGSISQVYHETRRLDAVE